MNRRQQRRQDHEERKRLRRLFKHDGTIAFNFYKKGAQKVVAQKDEEVPALPRPKQVAQHHPISIPEQFFKMLFPFFRLDEIEKVVEDSEAAKRAPWAE